MVGSSASQGRMVGGRTCLDFVNTVSPREQGYAPEAVQDMLPDYAALVAWSEQAGVVSPSVAMRLRAEARRRPKAARRAHARAIALRESLYRIFEAIALRRTPREADMRVLMARFAAGARRAGIARDSAGQFGWGWDGRARSLGVPTWAAARSALDLLVSPELERVKRCPGQGDCGWLFFDSSKNASRRWCSMETCGTVAKVAVRQRRHSRSRVGRSPVSR
ncbi:MAG TPA: ABATE domain-containing protein [Gemmatimonadaceae bacterium]|nr:ABATE domain-containing protein [Gemmatimonadaceae bacterium]